MDDDEPEVERVKPLKNEAEKACLPTETEDRVGEEDDVSDTELDELLDRML